MPLCTLHLFSLSPQTTVPQFASYLKSCGIAPLTLARVVRWIIVPNEIDTADLLSPAKPYELLLIRPGTKPLPGVLEDKMNVDYTLQVGIPSRLLKDFSAKNKSLLHPNSDSIPELTGSLSNPIVDPKSSQTLTLSPDLQTWIESFSKTSTGRNAMSMLNFLSFHPDKKDSYLKYGRAFAETIGSKRGGDAKLVGHVVYPSSSSLSSERETKQGPKWDEFALAHYPSVVHFADMLASKDYQDVNQKFRVPALRDTCILCTSEIDVEDMIGDKAKL